MIIKPDTDLAPLTGVRVRVHRTVNGQRFTYVGTFESLWHSDQLDGAGGMFNEEHGPRRGGIGGFHLPYGAEVQAI